MRIANRKPPNLLQRMWRRFEANLTGRKNETARLSFDDQGVTLHTRRVDRVGESAVRAEWTQITEVTAFKRDLLTIDLMCVSFSLAHGEELEVNEDVPGFDRLMEALPDHLEGFPITDRWWRNVLLPPFEANEKSLWRVEGDVEQV